MRNLNTEKCNAVYELMRIMSGTKLYSSFSHNWIGLVCLKTDSDMLFAFRNKRLRILRLLFIIICSVIRTIAKQL